MGAWCMVRRLYGGVLGFVPSQNRARILGRSRFCCLCRRVFASQTPSSNRVPAGRGPVL